MISSCFELNPPVQQGNILQQVKAFGDVQRVVATEQGWELRILLSDFETARGLFGYLMDQNVETDIRWMVKDKNAIKESRGYPNTDVIS